VEYLIAFILGWFIGHRVNDALNRITMRDLLKDLGITEQQLRKLAERHRIALPDSKDSQLEEIEIRIEEHEGTLYAYRTDTDQFLGQGPDRDGLIQRLTENLTNVRLVVSKEQGADHLLKP